VSAINLVQHYIDYDSGDRNVQPYRKSPAGDATVAVKSLPQSRIQREQHQRHHSDRQQRVRDQDRKIQRPRPALSGKMHRMNMRVIVEIRSQEQGGGDNCGDHAGAVQADSVAADQHSSGSQKHSAGAIETGVDDRKNAVIHFL
jgi:hypothetical protein